MTHGELPSTIDDVEQLENLLSEPTEKAVQTLASVPGDILLLGVAGKMGPSLARMARRAADAHDPARRIIGVSRFSTPGSREELERYGVETIQGDLLDPDFIAHLPEAPNVIYMTGMKFGASDDASRTWAMNVYLPAMVGRQFRRSRIVAFSSGNIYGLTPVADGGSRETDPLRPEGEYPMTCVGRERMFEYMSRAYGIPTVLLRLNYAHELRYGVLVDLAQMVYQEREVPLAMGYANVIWQADANAMTLCALADVSVPPYVVNIAGGPILSVREVAERFAAHFGKPVRFTGQEADDAFLSNGAPGRARYGEPRVSADQLIDWVAQWVKNDKPLLGRPTHFEVRSGKY